MHRGRALAALRRQRHPGGGGSVSRPTAVRLAAACSFDARRPSRRSSSARAHAVRLANHRRTCSARRRSITAPALPQQLSRHARQPASVRHRLACAVVARAHRQRGTGSRPTPARRCPLHVLATSAGQPHPRGISPRWSRARSSLAPAAAGVAFAAVVQQRPHPWACLRRLARRGSVSAGDSPPPVCPKAAKSSAVVGGPGVARVLPVRCATCG